MPGKINSVQIMSNALTSGTISGTHEVWHPNMTFQAICGPASGTGVVTVNIEGSLDETNFTDLGTITVNTTSGVTASDGLAVNAAWRYIRANAVGITGTGATYPSVDVWMGNEDR